MKTKYTYEKKLPKYREYKSENKYIHIIKVLEVHKKIGILFMMLGIVLISYPLLITLPIFSSSNTKVINPVPLSVLAAGIQKKNIEIDKKSPLKNYVPQNQSYDYSYNKPFYLSFPSLNLKDVKVTPNVDSNDDKSYEKVLQNSVAHFKGTALPGEGGNTFIYGHSSVTWFHKLNPKSYEGVFTALFDLNIGDKITLTFDNKDYTYIVEGIDTIKVNDFSQIQNITGVNTLTLMTCSPPGVGDKRLIVKAVQI